MNVLHQHKKRIEAILKESVSEFGENYESKRFFIYYNPKTNDIECKSKDKMVSNVRINLNRPAKVA